MGNLMEQAGGSSENQRENQNTNNQFNFNSNQRGNYSYFFENNINQNVNSNQTNTSSSTSNTNTNTNKNKAPIIKNFKEEQSNLDNYKNRLKNINHSIGKNINSRIKERLIKEAENDVSLRVVIDPKSKDAIQVYGRGDLHLGILIEKLRREGFEMTLFPPQVVYKTDEKGNKLEPIELLTIEFQDHFLDTLLELIMPRLGEVKNTTDLNDRRIRVELEIPSRGMFGLRTKLINITKGHVIIQSKLKGYEPFKGQIQ